MSSALFKVVAFLELEKRDPLWHCAEIISFTFMICLEDSGVFCFFFFLTLHSLCMERLGSLYSQRNSACGFVVWELFRRKTGQLEFEKQSSNCSLDHMQPWGLAKVLSAFED